MPFLAYLAIILVSLTGILFEVNWLTSPKLETKPAAQASAAAPAKVAAATPAPPSEVTSAPKAELNEDVTEPKVEVSGPRNVAPNVTMVPGGAVAAKPAEKKTADAAKAEAPASPAPQPQQTAAITPPPVAAAPAPETTGTGSIDFKREFTNDAKAGQTNGSTATFTPASTVPAAPVAAASMSPNNMSTNNKCDIAACSASYQSFRASDCTYQPMDGGARKFCERGHSAAQQAAVQPGMAGRDFKGEAAARKANKEAGLRAFEREVRRITASEASLDSGYERGGYGRDYERAGRSQVIVIDRRDW